MDKESQEVKAVTKAVSVVVQGAAVCRQFNDDSNRRKKKATGKAH